MRGSGRERGSHSLTPTVPCPPPRVSEHCNATDSCTLRALSMLCRLEVRVERLKESNERKELEVPMLSRAHQHTSLHLTTLHRCLHPWLTKLDSDDHQQYTTNQQFDNDMLRDVRGVDEIDVR